MRNTLASLVVILCSCGVEPSEPLAEPTATVRQELTLPRQAIELATWTWGSRFIPTTAKSAYVVGVQDPHDPLAFYAWGFDVKSQRALFFVHGGQRAHLQRFQAQLAADVSYFAVGSGFDPGFSWGSALQVGMKPPPPPPGGTDWTVWSGYAWKKTQLLHEAAVSFGQ